MFETLALCTSVLGFFMALPLMILGRTRPANFWLGLFVFSVSCICVAEMAANSGFYQTYPQWAGIFDWPVAVMAPAFYCYVCSLIDSRHGQRRMLHFLPALLLSAWLFLPRAFTSHLGEGDQQLLHVNRAINAVVPLLMGLSLLYAIAVIYKLRQFRTRLREIYSSTKGRDLQWLSWLTANIATLLVVWILACAFGGMWDWMLVVGRIALFYFVGWYGMRQTSVFLAPVEVSFADGSSISPQAVIEEAPIVVAAVETAIEMPIEMSIETVIETPVEPAIETTQEVEERKYSRSGMTESSRKLIGVRLAKRMQVDKDFRESDLKLLDLAARIGTSPHLLSQYLNEVLGRNFFDYVNGLRVAEVQNLLRQTSDVTRSLLDVSHQAGFNSKSHFNASFRKVTGMTPSAWRRTHADQQEIKGPLTCQSAI